MNKYLTRNRIILILSSLIVLALFVLVGIYSRKKTTIPHEETKPLQVVTVESAGDSHSFAGSIEYPAIIAGDQEIDVAAKSDGSALTVNFALGDFVSAGALLVKIDDIGPRLGAGVDGFRSSDVKQDKLAIERAEEALEIAEKTYEDFKDQYDFQKKNPTAPQTVTKAQRDAAKEAIDLAEIDVKNAKVGYFGTLDDRLIISPISGYVTKKSVETGDSITSGQPLFSISKTKKVKIQFYVDEAQLSTLAKGAEALLIDNNGNSVPIIVRNISPQADVATKRFLIEAYPKNPESNNLIPGTVVRVSFSYTKTPSVSGAFILPLSAVNIGQNENYIFVAEDGKAKKVNVEILSVDGETASLTADLPEDAEIIIEGSKLVSDGQEISITR